MNNDAVHSYLSRSYWAKNIPKSVVKTAIENSLCFAVLAIIQGKSTQVGFARMITDYATVAYLADVYILEEHRGQGLSKKLMAEIIQHPKLQGLRRMLLATSDAHGLYQQFGFKALASPEIFMELWTPNIYQVS
ncbi:GNAT family N-acetyltransferase [Colwellia sp. D2M02]|nr:GNAT family N-acetyltransferase [Colwellia sp. D2M02]MBU2893494.1 GNAT family N-acetyltransferase [Colwellia sp. D2M02]